MLFSQSKGDIVTSELVFRFRDGSVDEDKTVFSQRDVFRLISDHHIQRGPSFPEPSDVLIDVSDGRITSREANGQVRQAQMDLPADPANGLPPNLLLNILPSASETDISYLLPTTKPRVVRVSVKPSGMVPFTVGGSRRKAVDYVVHIELGGLTGIVAPLIGKQPKDFTFGFWVEPIQPSFEKKDSSMRVVQSGA